MEVIHGRKSKKKCAFCCFGTKVGPVLDAWIQNIRDVYRLHQHELDNIADDELRHRRLVELNVAEQCLNIYKCSVVQKARNESYKDKSTPIAYPRVHGLVFDPATGVLSKVPIDYKRNARRVSDLYSLFEDEKEELPPEYLITPPTENKKE